jgi:hypothetical protein
VSSSELVDQILKRAGDAHTRIDCLDDAPALPPPATAAEIAEAEARLGFRLHPFHALLLTSVANGGFGPGYGLYGVGEHGHRDDASGDAVGMRRYLGGENGEYLPPGAVPIVDFGCACWALVDATSEHGGLLVTAEEGVFQTDQDLRSFFAAWAAGQKVAETLYDVGEVAPRPGINPFTRQPTVFRSSTRRPRGRLVLKTP